MNAPLTSISPRITMIAAVDTMGNVYYALLQANSNEDTIRLFLYRLVEHLDAQRPDWRIDTVLQLDGASYHRSNATLDLFKQLNIPTMISGPYQYDGAACELLFAALKKGDLNPRGLRLSKKVSISIIF
jgi:hypothetical protein